MNTNEEGGAGETRNFKDKERVLSGGEQPVSPTWSTTWRHIALSVREHFQCC